MRAVYVFLAVMTCLTGTYTAGQANAAPPASQPVPAVDGALGPCSVEFTTKDGNGNIIAGATLRLHLAYGFAGVRRLDLEVTTNTDGKAQFTGLPDNLKKGLFFRGFKDDREGTAFYEPKKSCKGQHTMVLERRPAQPEQDGVHKTSGHSACAVDAATNCQGPIERNWRRWKIRCSS